MLKFGFSIKRVVISTIVALLTGTMLMSSLFVFSNGFNAIPETFMSVTFFGGIIFLLPVIVLSAIAENINIKNTPSTRFYLLGAISGAAFCSIFMLLFLGQVESIFVLAAVGFCSGLAATFSMRRLLLNDIVI